MLIKSISGIRGTIGGECSTALTPLDIVRFTAAYATFIKSSVNTDRITIVVGRDARISGEMVRQAVVSTLIGIGADVVDIGLATTPTTELAVTGEQAHGGIIITASHNPRQWNALKLLNGNGEFLNAQEGEEVLRIAEAEAFSFADVDLLGTYRTTDYTQRHIDTVLALPLVDVAAIRAMRFSVAVDAVNSVGGAVIPALLKALGIERIECLHCEPTGNFAHNPEPLEQNLTDIMQLVKSDDKIDMGFVVDPDVDRLAIISEDGKMFGEEYTLVAVADYVLQHEAGATVSNLSSSRALRDVTARYGQAYSAAAVGEVNVVSKMKETKAVIGGEGNGGVIYPACHYGRDALVGIALFLSYLAHKQIKVSALRATLPAYFMAKNKIELPSTVDTAGILSAIKERYANERITDIDGVKIDYADGWVHLRRSNTEPIIRIYSEAKTAEEAESLANAMIRQITLLL